MDGLVEWKRGWKDGLVGRMEDGMEGWMGW